MAVRHLRVILLHSELTWINKDFFSEIRFSSHPGSQPCLVHYQPLGWMDEPRSPCGSPGGPALPSSPRRALTAGWTCCHSDWGWPGPTARHPPAGREAAKRERRHQGWHVLRCDPLWSETEKNINLRKKAAARGFKFSQQNLSCGEVKTATHWKCIHYLKMVQ